jgi:hypothetical protein
VFALLDSLKQISGMNATVFVPGHGPLGTAGDLATNADYISICVDTARNIVAQGDISPERVSREVAPERFATWELSRFFTINLQSLCTKFAAEQAPS